MELKKEKKLGLFQKLFKVPNYYNAYVNVFNLIYQKGIKNTTFDDLMPILEKYKIKNKSKMLPYFQSIYSEYLLEYLKNLTLSDEEKEQLKTLKTLLNLRDKDIDKILSMIGKSVYETAVDKVIADKKLTDGERKLLEELEKDLKISKQLADKIYLNKAKKIYEEEFSEAIADKRLSPDEEKELQELANSLGINPQYDEKTKELLEKYKELWFIENGDLPEIPVDIHLKRGEKCYWQEYNVSYYETRKVRKRLKYMGPTVRIRIMKGIYWRAGDLGYDFSADEEWMLLDSGDLYITNKRIIFYGDKKVKSVNLDKILDIKPVYGGGFIVVKDSGKNPMFKGSFDTEIIFALLSRLFHDNVE